MPGFGEVGRGHVEGWGYDQAGIKHDIGGDGDFFLVVVQAVTAADHELVVETARAPGETDLRAEVILLRVPGISA